MALCSDQEASSAFPRVIAGSGPGDARSVEGRGAVRVQKWGLINGAQRQHESSAQCSFQEGVGHEGKNPPVKAPEQGP